MEIDGDRHYGESPAQKIFMDVVWFKFYMVWKKIGEFQIGVIRANFELS